MNNTLLTDDLQEKVYTTNLPETWKCIVSVISDMDEVIEAAKNNLIIGNSEIFNSLRQDSNDFLKVVSGVLEPKKPKQSIPNVEQTKPTQSLSAYPLHVRNRDLSQVPVSTNPELTFQAFKI